MKKNIKFIILILILIVGYIILRALGFGSITPQVIREFILSFGWKAPIIYVLLYTIRPLFLFPASILSLTGGLTFGPIYGTLLDLVGASLGAYLSFFLARNLGMDTVQRLIGRRFKKLDNQIETHGLRSILILRLIPLFPFDVVSYTSGLSKVKFIDFAIGTTVGIIPGSFVYNFLGSSLSNIFTGKFVLAVVLMILLFTIPLMINKLKVKR